MPEAERRGRQRDRHFAPQADAAGPDADPPRQAHPQILAHSKQAQAELAPASRAPRARRTAARQCRYFKPRTTGMSNSRIFLRNVLRLRPSRCAALI